MRNENNIINQITNDEKAESKKIFLEAINEVYDVYLGTLNNEENGYMNNEDERVGSKIEVVYPSEIGIKLNNNNLLYFGACKRQLFLKLKGAYRDEPKSFDEIASIERNELVKQQWVKKFKICGVYKEQENDYSTFKALGDIKLSNKSDGIVYDYQEDAEVVLLIKPIEYNFITKVSVFSESGKPMFDHIGEAVALGVSNKKKVKLLYVSKNNPKESKDFNIGANGGVVIVNGIEVPQINITDILNQFSTIKQMLEINMVPPRDFCRPIILNQEQINEFKVFNVIRDQEAYKYLNGKELYSPFRCAYCKYKKTCDALPDDWCEWDK